MLLSLSLSDWGYRMVLVVVGRIDRVADGWMGWRFTKVAVVVVVDGEVRCVGIGIHATSVHLVLKDDVQGVDDAGDVCGGGLSTSGAERLEDRRQKRLTTENGQQQVDEEVGTAAALEEDSEGRQHDGADDLDDVAVGAR
jgi:hypothetical protein